MRLLYFATSSFGGLADYAREQIAALAKQGVQVEVLCAPTFPALADHSIVRHDRLAAADHAKRDLGRATRAWRFMSLMVGHHRELARTVRAGRFDHVLLSAYAEYFAPLWSGALRALAGKGVRFGAVVHDPVRDAVLGPEWWHRRSVAGAYSFLRHAFVHEALELDTAGARSGPAITVIPHGPYVFNTPIPSRDEARRKLGVPLDKPVLLAFGHIRDNKNLHLTLEAMRAVPELHLLVAGSELSSGQRQARDYQELAALHGVGDRCHWHARFIPESESGVFFAAADFISLTYGGGFRSASGVLSVSSQFRKPCIASSGAGPLRTLVGKYTLGVWVDPDDTGALARGLRELLAGTVRPRWDAFMRENSWEENARIVARTMFPSSS